MANTEPMTIPYVDLDDVTGGNGTTSGSKPAAPNAIDDFVRQIQQHLAQPPSSALGGSQPQTGPTPVATPLERA